MIIETANPATRRLAGHRDGDEDEDGVEHYEAVFDRTVPADATPDDEDTPDVEARRARVPADVGEYLAETCEAATIHEDEREAESDDDGTDTPPGTVTADTGAGD